MRIVLFAIIFSSFGNNILSQDKKSTNISDFENQLTKYLTIDSSFNNSRAKRNIADLDSILRDDETNLKVLNARMTYFFMIHRPDKAWLDFKRIDTFISDNPEFLFYKASNMEHFGALDSAEVLYNKYSDYLSSKLHKSKSEAEESEILLNMWYLNRYLFNEKEADKILNTIYNEYEEWVSVGINPKYFYNRFGDGIFDDINTH